MPQIFDVIANENACYKRNELEFIIVLDGYFAGLAMHFHCKFNTVHSFWRENDR